jgi:hypothetical protein
VDILIDVFTPFYEGTVMLSGSRYPTLSTAYFFTRCLFTYLERNEDDDSEIKLQLKSFLLERSKHYLKVRYSNDQKDAMLIAAFLDPVCFAILNELEIEKAKKLILKKQNYFELDESTIRNKKIKKTETFHSNFASLCGIDIINNNTVTVSLNQEMSDYVNLIRRSNSISFSEFWRSNCHRFKILVLYVKYYSIISGSSVSDESSFSKANFLQRKERSSLSSENLRYTMILKQKKAIQELKFLD